MVVSFRPIIRAFPRKPSGHAEMNAQPMLAAEAKRHLLARRDRFLHRFARQPLPQGTGIDLAKDPLVRMEIHPVHRPPFGDRPLLSVVFDFGKFRHDFLS